MPKPPPPNLSPEDIALFHEAIGPVQRLAETAPQPRRPAPAPRPRSRERDEAEALRELRQAPFAAAILGPGDRLEYLRDGYPRHWLRRLKRGQYTIEDEIDLHQLGQVEAEAVLRQFLAEVRHEGKRCVSVIHGKGLRSGSAGPVLKSMLDRILRHRADVIAFASADERAGGSGAVWVLLMPA